MEATIAILSVFGFATFITFMYFNTRHRERMALIDSGQDAGIFKMQSRAMNSLKWGLVLTMIGLALGIGIGIDTTMGNDGPIVTIPLVFLFAGIGLLIFYKILSDKGEDQV